MTYLKDGVEYLERNDRRVLRAVLYGTRAGKAGNMSQVASWAGLGRTTTANVAHHLRARGYLLDASEPGVNAYRWRLTDKGASALEVPS